jgi:glycosyltransferase involved in cell wall biosynthesis
MSVAPSLLSSLNLVAAPRRPSPPGATRRTRLPRIVSQSPAESLPIIAFCHLAWDGVWQRPQQLLSRLALKRPVLFVETYCSDVPAARVHLAQPADQPHLTVLQMHLPQSRWADGAFIDRERRRLLLDFLAQTALYDDPVLWFNDPMAVTAFAGHCNESAIAYDCMDELSQFKGAPPGLVERERDLLRRADVVFCGGRKMRDKRLPLNPNCHFFGTGVDCDHFGRARSRELAIPADMLALQGPVLGYFGVIDERIDYELLARLADALPRCSIAMVGPTAKVDPTTFPRRPNLHWLGRREYAELPAITKRFSVCLMPFALNAATEFINPTKALEYMATGKPVVSTALDEVRTNFNSVCLIARNHDDFIAQCRQAVQTPDQARIAAGIELASCNTWERITAAMDAHLVVAVDSRRRAHV